MTAPDDDYVWLTSRGWYRCERCEDSIAPGTEFVSTEEGDLCGACVEESREEPWPPNDIRLGRTGLDA